MAVTLAAVFSQITNQETCLWYNWIINNFVFCFVFCYQWKSSSYRWLSARLQYLQCVSNGDTAVSHKAIDILVSFMVIQYPRNLIKQLTYWGRDKMAAVFQTFSNAFSWMKIVLLFKIHWDLFLMVQLTICQHWFRNWLGAEQATIHYLSQWWHISLSVIYICLLTSICFNSLKPSDAYMRSNLTIIGSDNGLNQFWNIVNWTYRIKPQNFSEIFIEIDAFSPKKMSAKWRPFPLGVNVLRCHHHKLRMACCQYLKPCLLQALGRRTAVEGGDL